MPPVEATDLVSYLVLQTSFVTAQQFKAHKYLESYNQFVCGWVKEVRTWKVSGYYVTTGRVSLKKNYSGNSKQQIPLGTDIVTFFESYTAFRV